MPAEKAPKKSRAPTPVPLNEKIPRADDVYMNEPGKVADAVDAAAAPEAPAGDTTPAPPADGEPAPAEPPPAAETPADAAPPAPVIIVFARPPLDVENEIRAMVAEGKDPAAIFRYRRWLREADAERAAAEGIEGAQDAVRWLVAQPPLEPEPVADPVLAEGESYDRPPLRLVPKPATEAPVVARITPPPRQKITQVKEVQHCFALTTDEMLARGQEFAHLQATIEAEQAEQSELKRAMKQRLDALTARRSLVADVLRKKSEVRGVRVAFVSDFERGVTYMVLEESGDMLGETTPMADADRQMTLFARAKATAEVIPTDAPEPPDADGDGEGDGDDPDNDE